MTIHSDLLRIRSSLRDEFRFIIETICTPKGWMLLKRLNAIETIGNDCLLCKNSKIGWSESMNTSRKKARQEKNVLSSGQSWYSSYLILTYHIGCNAHRNGKVIVYSLNNIVTVAILFQVSTRRYLHSPLHRPSPSAGSNFVTSSLSLVDSLTMLAFHSGYLDGDILRSSTKISASEGESDRLWSFLLPCRPWGRYSWPLAAILRIIRPSLMIANISMRPSCEHLLALSSSVHMWPFLARLHRLPTPRTSRSAYCLVSLRFLYIPSLSFVLLGRRHGE